MADVEVEAVLADPEGVLERLRAQESGLERALAVVRRRIEVAARLAEAAAQWRELAGGDETAGGDTPGAGGREVGPVVVAAAERDQVTGGEDPGEDPGGGGDAGGRLPRRVLVANLLGQDPGRIWRVAEVGQALGVDNLKSLGVLMSQMAGRGVLVKEGSGCYRASQSGDGAGVVAV